MAELQEACGCMREGLVEGLASKVGLGLKAEGSAPHRTSHALLAWTTQAKHGLRDGIDLTGALPQSTTAPS